MLRSRRSLESYRGDLRILVAASPLAQPTAGRQLRLWLAVATCSLKGRRRSECSATTTELSCLAGSETACAGDPTCLNIIQLRKADIVDMKAEFGCWLSP
jgi:hypothetical protein